MHQTKTPPVNLLVVFEAEGIMNILFKFQRSASRNTYNLLKKKEESTKARRKYFDLLFMLTKINKILKILKEVFLLLHTAF